MKTFDDEGQRAILEPLTTIEMEHILKALASSRRLLILEWLKDPKSHFPPQVHGDQEKHGVCTQFIAEKLAVSQPATSRHLKLLSQAGLVTASPVKGWTYYRRNESNLSRFTRQLSAEL